MRQPNCAEPKWFVAASLSRGFTLIELLVTIAVFAILVTLAAPSFSDFLANARMNAATNNLVAGLQIARSEAVKRNQTVTICARIPPSNDCVAGGDWATGWLAFVDTNENFEIDGLDDVIVRTADAVDGDDISQLAPVPIGSQLQFLGNGTARAFGGGSATGTISSCDDRGVENNAARGIQISFGGAIHASPFVGGITCP